MLQKARHGAAAYILLHCVVQSSSFVNIWFLAHRQLGAGVSRTSALAYQVMFEWEEWVLTDLNKSHSTPRLITFQQLCQVAFLVRPLGRPRRRWEDNIKMDLQEVGGGRGDWMELAQDRGGWRALVGAVRNFRVP